MKKKQSKLERAFLSKPGDTIIKTIDALKMSQIELAERMGKTASKINDLISGKEPITMNTALQLENVLGIEADFWLARENTYRERLARIVENEELECYIPWLQLHPLKELKKFGYLKSSDKNASSTKDLLLFYAVVSPQQWEVVYVPQTIKTNYRKSEAFKDSTASMTAWLRIGELEMKKMTLPEFNKESFKEALLEIKKLVESQPPDFARQLQKTCLTVGVAIIYTPCLPKAPVSGAVRWFGGNPLIQLSDRYKTNDQFWFTFYHEAAHILLHGKKDIFTQNVSIEDFNDYVSEKEEEDEANNYSAKLLLPESFIQGLPENLSIQDILEVARKYQTHPAIVIGRLQHLGIAPYSFGSELKVRVDLKDYSMRKNVSDD